MTKLLIRLSGLLLLLGCSLSYAQTVPNPYKRSLNGISGTWHKIILTDEVLGKATDDLRDLRIIGLTATNDTLEVPYLRYESAERVTQKEVQFKIYNVSHNASGYYFTLEIPTSEAINQIKLDFKQQNFDWPIQLQGSQNLTDWFMITERARLISIHNHLTNFEYTQLSFERSKYRYFRLCIQSPEQPDLLIARVEQQQISAPIYRDYRLKSIQKNEYKANKQTELNIELAQPALLSCLKIQVGSSFDYYRPIVIEQLTDSIKTERGWQRQYTTLATGTLNSIEKNEFTFNSSKVRKLRIIIENHDNQPLTIESVTARGYQYALWARFTQPAQYFLCYGNPQLSAPKYDLDVFADKIPQNMMSLALGPEITTPIKQRPMATPLFTNKIWLWGLMGLIILVLGWFSVKMLRSSGDVAP